MKKNLLFPKIHLYSKPTFIVIFCFITASVFAQNPLLLSSPFPSGSGRSIQKIIATQSGKTFYNTVDNNNHFSNLWGLWITDGTQAGTKKLTLTSPAIPGGTNLFTTTEATMLTVLGNDKIVFAGDNEGGYGEVWVSDGTQAGTFVLEQFYGSTLLGPPVQNITSFADNTIYSVVTNDNKLQLHKSNGTYAGTTMIYDFGDYTKTGVNYFKTIGSILYFELSNGITNNNEIWRTDGTTAGTYQVKDLGKDYGFASDFMWFQNNIYFITISSTYGDYIWKSDGTNKGTAPLKQISTSFQSDNTFPSYAAVENAMILANNVLYFAANDGTHGKELWKTDGTAVGTGMIFDFSPGSTGSNPNWLTVLNNELYFSANSSLFTAGNELFKYNGSQFSQPIEVYPGPNSGNPYRLTLQNNTILFAGQRSNIPHFWLTDGSQANTIEISESVNSPSNFSVSGNNVFFSANSDINKDGIDDPCIYKYTVPQKIWTGNVNSDVSNIDNWFPAGGPSQTDNVLISPSSAHSLIAPPLLFCNDLINNGGKIIMQNGLILMNGNFYNEGVVDNSVPGVFGVVGNTNRNHSIGSPGIFVGQFTASSNVIMNLTANTKFNALRIEGADTIYLGDYQLTVDNYPILIPTYITNGFGKLFLPVGSKPVTFSLTNPVTITNNGTTDYFGVSVNSAVLKDGFNGDTVRTQVVNKTWDIVKQKGGPANVNINLQWNAADELPGFDRSHIYLNHYTNGAWDNGTQGAAKGTGPFTFSRNGITGFSPFSISSSLRVLPVTLIFFTGQKLNSLIQLSWLTASEKNVSFYEIQRSADGKDFMKLNQVDAYKNNALNNQYLYNDEQPLTGNNFYRLKMFDADGKFSFSKIIAIKMDRNLLVQIFPNPAANILNIQVNGNNENATIHITDINGRKVKEENALLNGNITIDISKLPKGTYNLSMKSKSINENMRFVKE